MMVIGHSKVQSGFEYVITGKHFFYGFVETGFW